MQIRKAGLQDRDRVRELHVAAFPEVERDAVAALAVDLLAELTTPETFALVAEIDGALVGHITFSPVTRVGTEKFLGYILAPLAVHPEFQRHGISTNLIQAGIDHLLRLNVDIVFVYGDPRYYGRFGFEAAIAAAYMSPYPLQYPFGWQARPLADLNSFPSSGKLTCVNSLRNPQLW